MAARPRQISDEEILKGACDCFLANGPGVSTQVIADKLGISQAALFKRFGTKEDLMMEALFPPEDLPALKWMKQVRPGEDFVVELKGLIEALWASIKIIFPRISVLFASGIPHSQIHARFKNPPLLVILENAARWFGEAQQRRLIRSDGDPYIWAQTCMGAMQGRATVLFVLRNHSEIHRDGRYQSFVDDETFVRGVSDLILRGMVIPTGVEEDE